MKTSIYHSQGLPVTLPTEYTHYLKYFLDVPPKDGKFGASAIWNLNERKCTKKEWLEFWSNVYDNTFKGEMK